jgi:hypothetical protein
MTFLDQEQFTRSKLPEAEVTRIGFNDTKTRIMLALEHLEGQIAHVLVLPMPPFHP